MPLWATVIIVGAVVTTGGGVIKILLSISRELGSITATIKGDAKRIDDLEDNERDHRAEHVAYRNDYAERTERRRRPRTA